MPFCIISIPVVSLFIGFAKGDGSRFFLDVVVLAIALFLTKNYAWKMKRVVAYDNHLQISDLFHTTNVPYHQISDVAELTFILGKPTKLTFHEPCVFGNWILYAPYPHRDGWLGFDSADLHPANLLIERRRDAAITRESTEKVGETFAANRSDKELALIQASLGWVNENDPIRLSAWNTRWNWFALPLSGFAVSLTLIVVGLREKTDFVYAGFFLFIVTLIYASKYTWKLKKVVAYRNHLEIGSLLRTINVPYQSISRVVEFRLATARPTKLFLTDQRELGSEILYRPFFMWSLVFHLSDAHPANQLIEHRRDAALSANSLDKCK